MALKSSAWRSALSTGSVFLRKELASSMRPWAFSRLFQKPSWAIKESSSARRFCAPGKSKIPPQMGDFFPGGWQLDFNLLKHDGGTYNKSTGTQPANCRVDFTLWIRMRVTAE